MKKIAVSLVCFSTITACANDIPGNSDIKKTLEIAFQTCARTHIGNVKKINGMEGKEKNKYIVAFEFDLKFDPSDEALAHLESYTTYIATLEKNDQEYKEGIKAVDKIKEASKDFTQKAYDAELNRMLAANSATGGSTRELAEYSAKNVASQAINDYFRKLYEEGKISKPTWQEMEYDFERNKQIKTERLQ